MPKNVLQDVLPPRKKSIRNIPLPGKRKEETKGRFSNFPGPIEGIRPSQQKGKSLIKKWWVILIILILAIIISPLFFSKAKIILTPKQENVDLNVNIRALNENSIDEETKNKDEVFYKILTVEKEGSETTLNVEEKDVDKKASGKITILNRYNSSPQKLIKNTRFETKEGLIYRISKSVVVPGKTTKEGKTVPGSVTVTVYADSPGESYNIGLTDFTIPGFKGTDRYSKFSAHSETPMKGGFSGVMKIVDDKDLKDIRKKIHTSLENEMRKNIYAQVPEGFILYRDGIYFEFESQENIDLGDSVQVVEKGILKAVLLNEKELSNYIAKTVVGLEEEKVKISNLDELSFSIKNKIFIEPWSKKSIDFNLEGNANFVWVFDENKIKEDFAGQSKKKTNYILSEYKGVKEAEVVLSPFWKITFPKNLDKIKIEVFSN